MLSLPVPVGFGRANCPVTQHATRQWQTVSSGLHVCLLVHQKSKRVIWGTQALESVSLLHLRPISTHFIKWYTNVLIFEIPDSTLSMLHRDCCHVIIGIKSCHQKLVLSISPRESVWGGLTASEKYLTAPDRFPRPNGLGEIPHRPRPIPSGWLTTQVVVDRA